MPPLTRHVADSRRDLRYEIVFEPEGQSSIVLPSGQYLVGLNLEVPAEGAWSGDMELFDAEGDYLEELAINVGNFATVKLRFWDSDYPAPYFVGGVVRIEPEFTPEGVRLKLELASKPAVESVTAITARGWDKGVNPAAIVREIASKQTPAWSMVDQDGTPTVEDAAIPLDHAVQITDESDIAFIIQRILPYTVDEGGNHYVFRISTSVPTVVYFHSSFSKLVSKARKSYTYLRDPNGEVVRFVPRSDIVSAWLTGGGNAQVEAVDSAQGVATSQSTTAEGGVKGAGGVTTLQDATHVTKPKAGTVASRKPAPGRTVGESTAATQAAWSKASELAQMAELEVIGTHDVAPGEFLTVNYFRRNNTAHPMSGDYRVLKVSHSFGAEGWTTVFDLARNGNQETRGTTKKTVKVLIAPEDVPPASEATASQVRTGSTESRRAP